ncbi:MAG: hypothetical protein VX642_05900 [Bdellovibrionota bacterium]|nr:hypothetical protein [Bdellovibrionota bacterium]
MKSLFVILCLLVGLFAHAEKFELKISNSSKNLFQGKVDLKLNEDLSLGYGYKLDLDYKKTKSFKIISRNARCKRVNTGLEIEVYAEEAVCLILDPNNNIVDRLNIKLNYLEENNSGIEVSKKCMEHSLVLKNLDQKIKINGQIHMTCRPHRGGMYLSVFYSPGIKVLDSEVKEERGKRSNYKVYNLKGFGKISNEEDFVVNRLQMVDSDKQSLNFEIIKESFLSVRQSPFEVDIGSGLVSSALSGAPGTASVTSIRGMFSLFYDFYKSIFLKTNAEADLFELSSDQSSSSSSVSSNFFFSTQFLTGYRLEFENSSLDLSAGLEFANFSYVLQTEKLVFNRKDMSFEIFYRTLIQNRSNYLAKFNYSMAISEAGNSTINLLLGKRWGLSKFNYFFNFKSIALQNSDGPVTGTSIGLGILMDF